MAVLSYRFSRSIYAEFNVLAWGGGVSYFSNTIRSNSVAFLQISPQ
jgi:hypothetical protein